MDNNSEPWGLPRVNGDGMSASGFIDRRTTSISDVLPDVALSSPAPPGLLRGDGQQDGRQSRLRTSRLPRNRRLRKAGRCRT